MFSKLLFVCPLLNNDAITVSQAISDHGTKLINKCTAEFCRLLEVTHEFTPSFAHHCLGACERQHRTFLERVSTLVLHVGK